MRMIAGAIIILAAAVLISGGVIAAVLEYQVRVAGISTVGSIGGAFVGLIGLGIFIWGVITDIEERKKKHVNHQ